MSKVVTTRFKKHLRLKLTVQQHVTLTKTELLNLGLKDDPSWFAYLDLSLCLGFGWKLESFDENHVVMRPQSAVSPPGAGKYISAAFKSKVKKHFNDFASEEAYISTQVLVGYGFVLPPENVSIVHTLTSCLASDKFTYQIIGMDANGFRLRRKQVQKSQQPVFGGNRGILSFGVVNGVIIR